MLTMQVVPHPGGDVYRLLRNKVTHEAKTWIWANKPKTRLRYKQIRHGYIEVGSADSGVLVAAIKPHEPEDLFFLAEKFVGRLTAWFPAEILAINMQFGSIAKRKR
jgi:hypothetical protein